MNHKCRGMTVGYACSRGGPMHAAMHAGGCAGIQ